MASGQGSKSATLPSRAPPPKSANHESSPTFNRGFFGKLKKKFRKSKGYEFDFADSKNVEGVYFKCKKDDLSGMGFDGNHEKSRPGKVEVRRCQSERSPAKPPFLAVDFKQGIGNHGNRQHIYGENEKMTNENESQQQGPSLFNKSDVENNFLQSKGSEIDLDNEYDTQSAKKVQPIDDMDPGYETLDEVRQKMKNLPKTKSIPYHSEKEISCCSNESNEDVFEIRPKNQLHRRTQSSGTSERLFLAMSDFDPNRDSGLGSPLKLDSPGSRKNSMLYTESTISDTDICELGESIRTRNSHPKAEFISNLRSMRTGSCPLRVDEIDGAMRTNSSNHSDTCLTGPTAKVNLKDELYANPKVIMQKKSSRGSESERKKSQNSELNDAQISKHSENVAMETFKHNDLISESDPPPLPERKYSISDLDQGQIVAMETDDRKQKVNRMENIGSYNEFDGTDKNVNKDLNFPTLINSSAIKTMEKNVTGFTMTDEVRNVKDSNEISHCGEKSSHLVKTNEGKMQIMSCGKLQNALSNHHGDTNDCMQISNLDMTSDENSSEKSLRSNKTECCFRQSEDSPGHQKPISHVEISTSSNISPASSEVTHQSKSVERFPSITAYFPVKPFPSNAKCRSNVNCRSSRLKSSTDTDQAVSECDTDIALDSACHGPEISLNCDVVTMATSGHDELYDNCTCDRNSVRIAENEGTDISETLPTDKNCVKMANRASQNLTNLSNCCYKENKLEISNWTSAPSGHMASYGGLQVSSSQNQESKTTSSKQFHLLNANACGDDPRVGSKESEFDSIASSNTDDSLDLIGNNKPNIISYEDSADMVLESLEETLAGDFSSMENLLDCSMEGKNSLEEDEETLEEDGAPIGEPMKTSTCEKLEVCAASACDVYDNSNVSHFKRLPDFYYEDTEPIHMSLSELGMEEKQFFRKKHHDYELPNESNMCHSNSDTYDCTENCGTPDNSDVQINQDIALSDLPVPARLKTRSLDLERERNWSSEEIESHRSWKSKSIIEDRPPAIIPRVISETSCRKDFMDSMQQLKDCGWYWGPLSWDEAEIKLMNKPDGSFLVRDSSDDRYILSLSFNTNGHVHHTRIEHHKGKFSFWSQPDSLGKSTIKEFIEQCVRNSRNGQFLYFIRPSGPGAPPMPVHLLHPVSRFKQMQSLQHMCRFQILQVVRRDHIDQLPVPARIKEYLRETQYYVECLED